MIVKNKYMLQHGIISQYGTEYSWQYNRNHIGYRTMFFFILEIGSSKTKRQSNMDTSTKPIREITIGAYCARVGLLMFFFIFLEYYFLEH